MFFFSLDSPAERGRCREGQHPEEAEEETKGEGELLIDGGCWLAGPVPAALGGLVSAGLPGGAGTGPVCYNYPR